MKDSNNSTKSKPAPVKAQPVGNAPGTTVIQNVFEPSGKRGNKLK